MADPDSGWQRKGAALSDKTAREEFGLTRDEIVQAIRAGTLQHRPGSMYGNPFLRLLRREVEALVKKKQGGRYLRVRQANTVLAGINRELKRLRKQVAALEERKSKLMATLVGGDGVSHVERGARTMAENRHERDFSLRARVSSSPAEVRSGPGEARAGERRAGTGRRSRFSRQDEIRKKILEG